MPEKCLKNLHFENQGIFRGFSGVFQVEKGIIKSPLLCPLSIECHRSRVGRRWHTVVELGRFAGKRSADASAASFGVRRS